MILRWLLISYIFIMYLFVIHLTILSISTLPISFLGTLIIFRLNITPCCQTFFCLAKKKKTHIFFVFYSFNFHMFLFPFTVSSYSLHHWFKCLHWIEPCVSWYIILFVLFFLAFSCLHTWNFYFSLHVSLFISSSYGKLFLVHTSLLKSF